MPHVCHNAFAATGAVAVGTAAVTPGTLIAEIAGPQTLPLDFVIEHPSGKMPIHIELRPNESAPVVYIIRTARRLFEGKVFVETPDQ
jgi:2-methylaconitate cis-trans-isomerase PrpF